MKRLYYRYLVNFILEEMEADPNLLLSKILQRVDVRKVRCTLPLRHMSSIELHP